MVNLKEIWREGRPPYRDSLLRLAVVLLAAAAAFRLLNELLRLASPDPYLQNANDLRNFQNAMKGLFAGQPIYEELRTSPYPPASYAIFWPFLGWLDLTQARFLWTITVVAALAWLIVLLIRESKANSLTERFLVALLLLSMNGTGVTIGNGQLGIHILAALVPALLLIQRKETDGRDALPAEILVAFLVLFALAKPTITVPFLWIIFFAPHGKRILFVTFTAYLAITLLALSFQEQSAAAVLESWFRRASTVATERGYGNLHAFLSSIHMDSWMAPASLAVFGLLGIWMHFHRDVDLWILIGITALVARFWTYHRYYDDLLIILPMISLFRITKSSGAGNVQGIFAGLLLSIISFFNLARLYNISKLRFELITSANVILWILTMAFLLYLAGQQRALAFCEKGKALQQ